VLIVGELPDPQPGFDEVRIRVLASGINTGDIKKREGWLGSSMPYPRVIPHSDGAGVVDALGEGVAPSRMGERVWCYGAQSYRPFGTAAELAVVPQRQAVRLPETVSFEQGACLGIPGMTAHRGVFGDGPVRGRTVLVAGAAGAVGSMAVELAGWGGATVLATVRRGADRAVAQRSGAEHVFLLGHDDVASEVRLLTPDGVERIVEVALSANAELDAALLAQGGVIAAYSSPDPQPRLPFWPMLFNNVTIRLLGSDDFPWAAREQAVKDINTCLQEGRLNVVIRARFPIEAVAAAHDAVEHSSSPGRVVIMFSQ
jgi:NADPH2:quinone reductase